MFSFSPEQIKLLEENKDYILDGWLEYSIVQQTLCRHSIGLDFYKDKFASKVFDYAIGVIKEKNQLGACPVISVMLMLFKKKKIPLSDVFIICVHLKNMLLEFMLVKSLLDKNILDEVSKLMDYNFKGVIDDYVALYYKDIIIHKTCKTNDDKTFVKTETEVAVVVTSASQYMGEVEIEAGLISELDELEDDTLNTIDSQDLITQEALLESSKLFLRYSSTINTLYEFEELAYTLKILGDLLENSDFNEMDDDMQSYIQTYLKAIIGDLKTWRMSIFVTQEAEDIHYLDKTLLSSISQLQITLMPNDDNAEDEIEFF